MGQEQATGSFVVSIRSAYDGELIASASLTCPPDGGSHPNPGVACDQLGRADGWIEGIPEDPGPCTREYDPVIVAASGTWNGEPRHYRQEFSNRCVAVRATGGVIFDIGSVARGYGYYGYGARRGDGYYYGLGGNSIGEDLV